MNNSLVLVDFFLYRQHSKKVDCCSLAPNTNTILLCSIIAIATHKAADEVSLVLQVYAGVFCK
jgi:hypothetical protein